MYGRISNIDFIRYFLFFMPFVGLISYNISSILAYVVIILFIFGFLFFNLRSNQITKLQILYIFFMIFALYSSFIYNFLVYEYNNLYYLQFFGSQILFYLLFSLFVNIKIPIYVFKNYFFIMIIIMSASIIYDSILLAFNIGDMQLFYKADALSYLSQPLGVFGQFSINSTYLIVFFLIYLHFDEKK